LPSSPHLRDRHAQTTRQDRQKKAAAGAASSAFAGCFKVVVVAVVVEVVVVMVVLVAMQERCKSLLPCDGFTACLPAACHVHAFSLSDEMLPLAGPLLLPPCFCCLPSSCAGLMNGGLMRTFC